MAARPARPTAPRRRGESPRRSLTRPGQDRRREASDAAGDHGDDGAIPPLPRFAARALAWHRRHGRHDLPWQQPRTPYRVWLSEVMLQQTQVATAAPYFERFVAALPDLPALARAPLDRVLALWSGLGYYSRARNLHAAAQRCLASHGGELPDDADALQALPGIGRSTAGAILAQAFGRRAAILDGNVRRLLCRSHGIDGDPMQPALQRRLWTLAADLLPRAQLADYTQALMDLGATVCRPRAPLCGQCPLRRDCRALATDRVAELPRAKARAASPRRQASWLVLLAPGPRVLLERRPPTGIWGGLWSLPQFDDDASVRDALARRVAQRDGRLRRLPVVRHVFTHFTLDAQPWQYRLDAAAQRGVHLGPDERWLARDELTEVGLPQPVRRLVAAILHGHDDGATT